MNSILFHVRTQVPCFAGSVLSRAVLFISFLLTVETFLCASLCSFLINGVERLQKPVGIFDRELCGKLDLFLNIGGNVYVI